MLTSIAQRQRCRQAANAIQWQQATASAFVAIQTQITTSLQYNIHSVIRYVMRVELENGEVDKVSQVSFSVAVRCCIY